MKKNYLIPDTECAVVGAIFALCDGTVIDKPKPDNPGDPFPYGAPRRRVF